MDQVLQALAAQTRREILALVRHRELSAGQIAERFQVTRPAVSQHLTVLREAGLVEVRRAGTRRLYRARPQAIEGLRGWLDAFWTDRLGHLKYAIEEEHDGPTTKPADSRAVQRSVRVAADPATVFRYWTETNLLLQWMGRAATVEPRPGGRFRIDYNGTDVVSGTYLEVDPPRRLVFSWGWEAPGDSVPPGTSRVEVTFAAEGEATLVTVRHLGLPEDSIEGHATGWGLFLPQLAAAVTAG